MDRDLYAVLGVPSTSSEREIRHAFHELARKYHPDVAVGDPGAARKFIEASEAAQTLLDPGRRAEYDRYRTPRAPAATAPPAPPPPAWTAPAWTAPAETFPSPTSPKSGRASQDRRSWARAATVTLVTIAAVAIATRLVVSIVTAPDRVQRHQGPAANGTVLWKATGYRMDDGWGINLAGSGRRIQIYPGTSADLEVDSGYLSSGRHITFLPPGTPPSYPACFTALLLAGSQAEPLDAITPGDHADLCSSGSTGDIAYIHVTGKTSSGLIMNITIWHDI
jgi:hypothetical protein